jgi:hypothetical protein
MAHLRPVTRWVAGLVAAFGFGDWAGAGLGVFCIKNPSLGPRTKLLQDGLRKANARSAGTMPAITQGIAAMQQSHLIPG